MRWIPCALVLSIAASCVEQPALPPGVPRVIDVAPSEGAFDGAVAADLDASPDIVEVELEAREAEVEIAPGRTLRLWTYNGTLPGPRIEARVGDLVRVRFTNSLPEATTIHWHGLRVPVDMDGVTVTQDPVPAGGSFTYEFTVLDAGTFWYHPHVMSDQQVERGLYGAFVVRGDDEPEVTSEHVVVLDDLLIDDAWQLEPFDEEQAMVGRQGNLILTNGRAHPIAGVRAGGVHRFRFVNAANARYFRLALPGHTLVQIGTDGGLLETPRSVDDVLIVPGERADVLVTATDVANASVEWTSVAYDRGHSTGAAPDATIFQMRNTSEDPVDAPTIPTRLRTIDALTDATVTRELRLGESEGGHAGHGGGGGSGVTFTINGESFPDVEPLAAILESVEEWSIVNETEMDHPFHMHGFRFQLAGERAWRDTINVPAGETARFLMRLEANPGLWMFHCHILEHAERGMMGELDVQPAR